MAKHAPVFHVAAERAGVELVADQKLPWLTRHGHLAPAVVDALPDETRRALDEILAVLRGDTAVLAAKTRGSMSADFVHTPTNRVVEYDEVQHFTTARLMTLKLYPASAQLGFDPSAYAEIVDRWRARGDKGFAHKEAAEFPGAGGRQRQRAYFDAFRDLAAPYFGNGPLLRVAAPDNDYAQAAADLAKMLARA